MDNTGQNDMILYSIGEVRKMFSESMKELNEMVKLENGNIVLDGFYKIHLSRCNTTEKILDWVLHLNEKNWIDGKIINRFIELAISANNIKFKRGA